LESIDYCKALAVTLTLQEKGYDLETPTITPAELPEGF
jgi:hypothetical protein